MASVGVAIQSTADSSSLMWGLISPSLLQLSKYHHAGVSAFMHLLSSFLKKKSITHYFEKEGTQCESCDKVLLTSNESWSPATLILPQGT